MKVLIWVAMLSAFWQKPEVSLKVEITNVKAAKGKIWIAIFRPEEKFGNDKPEIYKIIEVKSKTGQNTDFKLPAGRYALAAYHDVNNNGELDKNFVGIPKEPYGFSNNFRPKFKAPTFEDCAFQLAGEGKTINVKLTD